MTSGWCCCSHGQAKLPNISLRGHRRASVITLTLRAHLPGQSCKSARRAPGAQVTASQHTPFPRLPQGWSGAGLHAVGRLDETCLPQSGRGGGGVRDGSGLQ